MGHCWGGVGVSHRVSLRWGPGGFGGAVGFHMGSLLGGWGFHMGSWRGGLGFHGGWGFTWGGWGFTWAFVGRLGVSLSLP